MTQDKENSELGLNNSHRVWLNKLLNNALIERYDVTLNFISKMLWPALIFILAIIFYSDVSRLIKQVSSNLSRTSKINIAGVEIEVYADALRGSDLEAYSFIEKLNRQELLKILEISDGKTIVDPKYLDQETKNIYDSLKQYGILRIDDTIQPPQGLDDAMEIELTDLGKRVLREIQSILVSFLNTLPPADEGTFQGE
ncbi:hypothetical protein H6F75_26120 [Nodosilinea sp. FACHB-131]|uniref:hypothetical protein n=1 Tax=Cyanophyceae TaxID=3028117 RepID=UPI00168A1AF7|nr:hypothetical protein [Nodosilinea sp. FACHB-131]MBD1876965.1 hypothetical protein [Nodosilinea sp. FACHB-131]